MASNPLMSGIQELIDEQIGELKAENAQLRTHLDAANARAARMETHANAVRTNLSKALAILGAVRMRDRDHARIRHAHPRSHARVDHRGHARRRGIRSEESAQAARVGCGGREPAGEGAQGSRGRRRYARARRDRGRDRRGG